jgi:hypothetical protein
VGSSPTWGTNNEGHIIMNKFKCGDRVRIISGKHTRPAYTVTPEMEEMIGTSQKISRTESDGLVEIDGFNWRQEDLELHRILKNPYPHKKQKTIFQLKSLDI